MQMMASRSRLIVRIIYRKHNQAFYMDFFFFFFFVTKVSAADRVCVKVPYEQEAMGFVSHDIRNCSFTICISCIAISYVLWQTI